MLIAAHQAGLPIRTVRAAIEVGALVFGAALGGNVGVGTIVFAVAIGTVVESGFWLETRSPLATRAAADRWGAQQSRTLRPVRRTGERCQLRP